MKYQGYIDHRDQLAFYLNDIKNDKDGFYYAVNKVYNYEWNKNSSFDGCNFWSYDQNADDTIGENDWRQVLKQSYIPNYYYTTILEYMALSQFDYTDEQILEKAKTI